MFWYTLALFIHFLGLIALFGGFVMQQRLHHLLKQASTSEQILAWADLLRTTLPMQGGGAGMLLVTGSFMAGSRWGFQSPWIEAAMGALLGLATLNLTAQASFLKVLRPHETPVDFPRLRAAIARPIARVSMAIANGLAVGVLWLMAAKPNALGSLLTLLVVGVGAGVLAILAERRNAMRSTLA